MSYTGCPCGNDVRQNDLDSVWLFVADSLMDELADSQAFFGLECRAGEKSEVWHCKECDRLIIFDDCHPMTSRQSTSASQNRLSSHCRNVLVHAVLAPRQ